MTVEQHLQQLIGTLAIQLVQKDAALDLANAEIARLKQFEPKPKRPRKKADQEGRPPNKLNGSARAETGPT